MMKQRRKLQLWHMLLLLATMLVIVFSMFLPVLHLDKEVVKNVAIDAAQQVLEEVSVYDSSGILANSFSDSTVLEEELDRQLENQIPDMSWSSFDIMTSHYGIPEELASEKLTDKLDEKLLTVRVFLWIFYLATVPLIALLFIVHFADRSKFIVIIPTTVYGISGIVGSCIALWKVPDFLKSEVDNFSDMISYFGVNTDEIMDRVDTLLSSLWSYMRSPGMYMVLGVFIFLLLLLGIVSVTGNRSTPVSQGRIQCICGEFAGAVIPVDNTPLYVGRDPQQCQLVLRDPMIGRVHFSFWYDASDMAYQVECYSLNGLTFCAPQYGSQQMVQGMKYQLAPGTQIMLNQGRETFVLL